MLKKKSCMRFTVLGGACLAALVATACKPMDWPASPLYPQPKNPPGWSPPGSLGGALAALKGHYAHYDIVAYEGETQNGTMRTFIISYGFTDFIRLGNKLVEHDRFCHAEHKINEKIVKSWFNDAATQAIKPRVAVVDVYMDNGNLKIWRPATPALIGISGDPDQPLSMDPNDPKIVDSDGDGHPGVTVDMKLGGMVKAQIYIARREVFQSDLTLYADGTLFGQVVDDSEQLVIDATMDMLRQQNNPGQYDDPGLSPILLVPIPSDLDTCQELMDNRDALFPPEPEFK